MIVRRRPRAHRRSDGRRSELAREWQEWVVENLLRNATPAVVAKELERRGVSKPLAERSVAELAAHPALAAARRHERTGRRLELVQRLLTFQARQAVHPSAIERRSTPSASEFFDRYYATSIPVVFTDLMTDWPALKSWTPENFRDRFRDVVLSATDEREADPHYDA
ncbi:MAG TPA: cupin-like domain-containing protein, partial [Polyangiaceae bacterium]|nr:cupin-like domain-containing protein [Polyangiaceae bacterium]